MRKSTFIPCCPSVISWLKDGRGRGVGLGLEGGLLVTRDGGSSWEGERSVRWARKNLGSSERL